MYRSMIVSVAALTVVVHTLMLSPVANASDVMTLEGSGAPATTSGGAVTDDAQVEELAGRFGSRAGNHHSGMRTATRPSAARAMIQRNRFNDRVHAPTRTTTPSKIQSRSLPVTATRA